jgi:5-methylcytosine-specific restriction endonuclease McrA
MVLARHPLCLTCLKYDRLTPATHADHVVPLPRPNWWEGDWSLENGQGMCRRHHGQKTKREQRASL